jgi:hypothetical protein
MPFTEHRHNARALRRPVWMPHPGLLAFIAVLWAVAGVAQVVPSI